MKYTYVACFYPAEGESGYTVAIPDLPGAITEGDSLENAFEMAIDCASGWLLDESEEDIPPSTPIEQVDLDQDFESGFKSYIYIDLLEYKMKYSNKSVRKNVTLPEWLRNLAEKKHINFSSVLQEALKLELELVKQPITISGLDRDDLFEIMMILQDDYVYDKNDKALKYMEKIKKILKRIDDEARKETNKLYEKLNRTK